MTRPETRLYVVAATDTGVERIIRAESKAKAVKASALARIATQGDLERLLTVGVTAEGTAADPDLLVAPRVEKRTPGRPRKTALARAKPPPKLARVPKNPRRTVQASA